MASESGLSLQSEAPPAVSASAAITRRMSGVSRSRSARSRTFSVSVGDRVLFTSYAGTDIKYGGEDYMIMREDDLLAIVG